MGSQAGVGALVELRHLRDPRAPSSHDSSARDEDAHDRSLIAPLLAQVAAAFDDYERSTSTAWELTLDVARRPHWLSRGVPSSEASSLEQQQRAAVGAAPWVFCTSSCASPEVLADRTVTNCEGEQALHSLSQLPQSRAAELEPQSSALSQDEVELCVETDGQSDSGLCAAVSIIELTTCDEDAPQSHGDQELVSQLLADQRAGAKQRSELD